MKLDEIGKKIIEEGKEPAIVTLIAGVINATGKLLFWKDDCDMQIGDYAVVENMNGYDLVKVVGTILTTEKDASKFSNTKYENMKKTICPILKEDIEIKTTTRG